MTAQAGSASSPPGIASATDQSAVRGVLRRQMRQLRAGLTPQEQRHAARSLARQALRSRLLKHGLKVAAYVPVRNEADLVPLIARALDLGCHVYLPRVVNLKAGRMEFLRFEGLRKLRRNALGLLEPASSAPRIAPRELDRAFVPLAAFDAMGNRLGSGGGFYDRRFAFLGSRRQWRRPRLIGVAYEMQRVPSVPTEPWDIVMDAVMTERRLYRRQGIIDNVVNDPPFPSL
jgi:5-formyltetrahydrofolate cyclo-ligase